MADELPTIAAQGVTPLVDLNRGAGAAERQTAAAWGQVASTIGDLNTALIQRQKAVDAAEVAKIRTALDLDADELAARPDLQLNPEGFKAAWEEHRRTVIEATPSRYAAAVGQYANVIGSRKAGEIVGKAATAQNVAAKSALIERRGVIRGKLDAWAKQGPEALQSEGYLADLAEYTEVERELGNPIFGSSPGEAEGRIASSTAQFMTTAALVSAERVYQEEGLAAAKAFIEKTVNDPELRLTATDREMIANEARQQINLIHQAEVEAERARKEAERERREAQREARDDFMLGIFAGAPPSRNEVLAAAREGLITEGQAAAVLRAGAAEQRRQAAEARREARESSALYGPTIERAAMGDSGAARYVVRLAEEGIIDPEEAAAAARDYARAKRDPQFAAGMNLISTSLSDEDDDKSGAFGHYRRLAAAGLINDPIRAANETVEKYRGRKGQTLPAPIFSRGVPRSLDEIPARLRLLEAQRSKVPDSAYREELRILNAWATALKSQERRK